ncbi:MAG: metallophosphoesterase [Planctomycetaceae bacterium]
MEPFATRIDGPVAVIGDVHGQLDKLTDVLQRLRRMPDFLQRWVVLIGDYVDRGPDPKAAIDLILALRREHPRVTAIAGNHDFAMMAGLGLIATPELANWPQRWLSHYDAHSTFESYGVEFGDLEALRTQLPDDHREFLIGLPWCVEHSRYLFVHAGLDSNVPFDVQLRILRQKDTTLHRPQWLCSKALVDADVPVDCPLAAVSGHVRVPRVEFRKKRVLVDTSGGEDGPLSAALLPEKKTVASHGPSCPAGSPKKSRWRLWNS